MNYQAQFNVTFPVMEKAIVNGEYADPAWQYLRDTLMDGASIEWNFHKFLVDGNGDALFSWKDYTNPASDEIVSAIEELLY